LAVKPGSEPVLRGMSCVCAGRCLNWSTVVDKTVKQTANVVDRTHFSALVNKVESFLVTKTCISQDRHKQCKLVTLSEKTGWLAPTQTLLFWLVTTEFRLKEFLISEENTFQVTNFGSVKQSCGTLQLLLFCVGVED